MTSCSRVCERLAQQVGKSWELKSGYSAGG